MVQSLQRARRFCRKYLMNMIWLLIGYQMVILAKTYVIPLYCGLLFSRLHQAADRNLTFHLVFLMAAACLHMLDYLGNCFLDPYIEKEMNLSRIDVYAAYHQGSWYSYQNRYSKDEQVNRMHYGVLGSTYTWSSVVTLIQKIAVFVAAAVYAGENQKIAGICFIGLIVTDTVVIFLYQSIIKKQNQAIQEKSSCMEGTEYGMFMQTESLVLAGIMEETDREFCRNREGVFGQKMKKGWIDGLAEAGLFLINGLWKSAVFQVIGTADQGGGMMAVPAIDQAIDVSVETCNELHEPIERIQVFANMTDRLVTFLYSEHAERKPGEGVISQKGNTLRIQNLSFQVEGKPLFAGISMEVKRGELVALMGPNGCGKTSLMRCICGLYPGVSETLPNSEVAYAPADEQLFHGTVSFNVAAGAEGWGKTYLSTEGLCAIVGMEQMETTDISELSLGQKQRVNLMRALMKEADLLLLDEIFANLDYQTAKGILEFLRDCSAYIICTVHDKELLPFFDKVYELKDGKLINNNGEKT